MQPSSVKDLTALGFDALARNDAASARRHFEQAVVQGGNAADLWFGLSCAFRFQGAVKEEEGALDRALGVDAKHVPALVSKGDWHSKQRNVRAASALYKAALNAASQGAPLAPYWREELERVRGVLTNSAREYQRYLLESLSEHALDSPEAERFRQALDLLFGKRRLYLQQPTNFYFPGLPQIQFYDRSAFSWAVALEAKTSVIRAELQALLAGGNGIEPYVSPHTTGGRGVASDPSWSVFNLVADGKVINSNADRCPNTMKALSDLPLCRVDGCSPSVMFSLLRSGAHIVPHCGLTNTRLICHLPLIVPENCGGLRVGNETRLWREGELLIFDDTIEHEAWNTSGELRAVLLFDVWRPELNEKEKTLVSAMLTAVNSYAQ